MDSRFLNINKIIKQLKVFGDVILLESQKQDHSASERSYIAALPKKAIHGVGKFVYQKMGSNISQLKQDPWAAIKDFREHNNDWLFGYLGYDLKNNIEDLRSDNESHNSLPSFYFMIPELLIEIDKSGEYKIIKGQIPPIDPSVMLGEITDLEISNESTINSEDYISNVVKAQDMIHEGDIYEINFSYLKEFDFLGSGWNLYQKMKEVGPVPFGAYLQIGEVEVCCASPERFLKREKNHVYSQPIKGTISNSEDSNLDELKNEKNLAENLMIVDLVRNDLNRVAIPGTVKVDNLFEVQSFETVHQLVSTVKCDVEDETDSIEIIKACFPMGSMTGAPKIAAMNAIEDLEDYKRGIYSGAIGYIKPDGDFDFNVVIRTAIIEDEKLTYPVGGAITSDSIPEDEWDETIIKTEALKKALK
jgi:para-aminobenzoate synthetase component 1